MPRVCSISRFRTWSIAVLLLAVFGSVAWAKPKVAILGLEVASTGGVVDPKDAANAGKLTEELRALAKGGQGKFEMAPNSNRELQDEKLMANCETEKPGCMAPIGGGLNADFLIYGRVEKAKDGYKLSIKLLNVKTKIVEEMWEGSLSHSQISSGGLKDWSKSVHAKLSGEKAAPVVVTPPPRPDKVADRAPGKLIVKIGNTKQGTVLIDGVKKGELADGTITLTLPDGPHLVAIEATGRRRHEEPVTITGGQTQTVSAELEEIVGPPPPPRTEGAPGAGWRKVTWASVGVGVAATAVMVYAYTQIGKAEDALECPTMMPCMTDEQRQPHLDDGRRWSNISWGMGVTAGVAGAVAIIGAWKGYFSKPATEKAITGTAGLRKRRQLEVTPVVSQSGAGATLRYDW